MLEVLRGVLPIFNSFTRDYIDRQAVLTISMQIISRIEAFLSCCRASLSHAEKAINISGAAAKI